MANILASVQHNLANLTRISGRDDRALFWPWAIVVFIVAQAATIMATVPGMASAMVRVGVAARVGQEQAGRPASASGPPSIDPIVSQMVADMGDLWLAFAIINGVSVLLLAAAVIRRLHDLGRTGTWGILPLPFMVLGIANTRAGFEFASGQRSLGGVERLAFFSGPLFWVSLLVLVVLLAGEGDRGPNRFGVEGGESPE